MPPTQRRSSFPGLEGLSGRRRALIDELTAARRESELSQTEIAARMGTSQSAVARLESGELDARLSTLERYAAALGRTVDGQVRRAEHSPGAWAPGRPPPPSRRRFPSPRRGLRGCRPTGRRLPPRCPRRRPW